jgi:long-chain acyl-CoA synthetase
MRRRGDERCGPAAGRGWSRPPEPLPYKAGSAGAGKLRRGDLPALMLLHDSLFARAHSDDTALRCRGQSMSYRALVAAVLAFAGELERAGVKRGDRVALHLPNGVDAVVAVYAVWALGAIIVPVSAQIRVRQLRAILLDAGAACLVTSPAGQPTARAAARCPLVVTGQPAGRALSRTARKFAKLAAIFYTLSSGSRRKGVMLGHRALAHAAQALVAPLGLRDDDVVLGALPLSCEAGLLAVATTLAAGAEVVLEPSFAFPLQVLATMTRQRVTVLPGVATMFARILALGAPALHRLSAVRALVNLGAPLPSSMVLGLRARFRWAQVSSIQGLPECAAVTLADETDLIRRPGCLGQPLGTEVAILDERGQPVASGQEGELVVRGGAVMDGYWRRPEETARRLRPGPDGRPWLFTGDRARRDGDGRVYALEAGDEVIESRGGRVSRREVATVIRLLPGVSEVAVVGVDHPVLGEAIKAVVTLEPGCRYRAREVIRHCRTRLEGFMIPQEIEFVVSRHLRLIA